VTARRGAFRHPQAPLRSTSRGLYPGGVDWTHHETRRRHPDATQTHRPGRARGCGRDRRSGCSAGGFVRDDIPERKHLKLAVIDLQHVGEQLKQRLDRFDRLQRFVRLFELHDRASLPQHVRRAAEHGHPADRQLTPHPSAVPLSASAAPGPSGGRVRPVRKTPGQRSRPTHRRSILRSPADVAQLARASACHAEGRGFESLHPLEERPRRRRAQATARRWR
jgi:hypothetical protein